MRYSEGVTSAAEIALTTSVNTGSLDLGNPATITGEIDNTSTFGLGDTVHKVGRTTGWSSGTVTGTCLTVNVSGSNVQMLCQTLVENPSARIVAGGDSGSPVFSYAGSNATILGILWGGSSSGNLFVFSPLQAVENELGAMTVQGGTGTVGNGGDGGDGGDGGSDCPPNSKSPRCR